MASVIPSQLTQLPVEILTAISLWLPNRDIKSLRLSCRALCAVSCLRLDRVFLSTNLRNIEVFRAVADHEVFRRQIVEIIWDDARLKGEPGPRRCGDPESPNFDPDFDEDDDDKAEDEDNQDEDDKDDEDDEGHPQWFSMACEQNVQNIKNHKRLDLDQPDHVTAPGCQQSDVLATGLDAQAFEYGLKRFPALQRITITPCAHGWILRPLYETPMIRAFPPSFNYPVPCSWPLEKQTQRLWESTPECKKDAWRGFRIITRALAVLSQAQQPLQESHGITEMVIDVNQLLTGLNAHVFDEECAEQRDFVSTLQGPGFRRLDLALSVGGLGLYGWRAFRSGCLRRTLAVAPGLEHISLVTDMTEVPDPWDNGPSGDNHFIPLQSIFPVDVWTHLRHFRLLRFFVLQEDLLSLLKALPATLRFVELSFLLFSEGNYRDLTAGMRGRLGWCERPVNERPHVVIGFADPLDVPIRGVWVDVPLAEFLYSDGPNPFGVDGWGPNNVPYGCGAVVKDTFDPAFEKPWIDFAELKRLGYIKV